MFKHATYILALLLLCACGRLPAVQASEHEFPRPVDTQDKKVAFQTKRAYFADGVYADNEFDGARLNFFQAINDTVFQASIRPENVPINQSPWYSFRLWSRENRTVYINLDYGLTKHRYHPKISSDRVNWTRVDESRMTYNADSTSLSVKVDLTTEKIYLSAQELVTSSDVNDYCQQLANSPLIGHEVIGKSRGGRDMNHLEISKGSKKGKKAIVLLSRQHPPEVTGFKALQSFIDELITNPIGEEFFNEYRVLIYPLLNPDGVDLGHWRHSLGGVDLNRDWSVYNQPEVKLVANHIVNETTQNKNQVILGLDFHSTWYDVYYTFPEGSYETNAGDFKKNWLTAIEREIGGEFKINEKPSNVGGPVSKGWFYMQFNAEGITYEIGDDTEREFIDQKGRVSAIEMMKTLLNE